MYCLTYRHPVFKLPSDSSIACLHVTSRRPCWWSRTKAFSPLGTKLYFHVNSARKYSFVLTPNMAALLRGCKPRILYHRLRQRRFIPFYFSLDCFPIWCCLAVTIRIPSPYSHVLVANCFHLF